jgi:Ca-activated chloride channel family protein
VLLSDGKRTVGRTAQEGRQAAKAKNTPVYTICFGTDSGFIEMDGIRQRVPPDRTELAQIAETSGGEAYTAESAGELEDVYKDIGSSVGYDKVDKEVTARRRHRDAVDPGRRRRCIAWPPASRKPAQLTGCRIRIATRR